MITTATYTALNLKIFLIIEIHYLIFIEKYTNTNEKAKETENNSLKFTFIF